MHTLLVSPVVRERKKERKRRGKEEGEEREGKEREKGEEREREEKGR